MIAASNMGTYYQTGKAPPLEYIYVYALTPQLPEKKQLGVYVLKEPKALIPDQAYIDALPGRIAQLQPPQYRHISDVDWEYPSYQIYIMYQTNYRFVKDRAVRFTYYDPPFGNHTFWDGTDYLDQFGEVVAVVCRNLRLNHLGGDLGKSEEESEKFSVEFTTIPAIPERFHPKLHDESGTNTGP